MGKSQAQRSKEHRERMNANGFKEVKVWVPVALIEKLKTYAKKLCASATK